MSSLLGHPALFDDQDKVGVHDGRKVMGYDKGGFAAHEPIQRLIQFFFCGRIDSGDRVDELFRWLAAHRSPEGPRAIAVYADDLEKSTRCIWVRLESPGARGSLPHN
jgi:hypothetical protein